MHMLMAMHARIHTRVRMHVRVTADVHVCARSLCVGNAYGRSQTASSATAKLFSMEFLLVVSGADMVHQYNASAESVNALTHTYRRAETVIALARTARPDCAGDLTGALRPPRARHSSRRARFGHTGLLPNN